MCLWCDAPISLATTMWRLLVEMYCGLWQLCDKETPLSSVTAGHNTNHQCTYSHWQSSGLPGQIWHQWGLILNGLWLCLDGEGGHSLYEIVCICSHIYLVQIVSTKGRVFTKFHPIEGMVLFLCPLRTCFIFLAPLLICNHFMSTLLRNTVPAKCIIMRNMVLAKGILSWLRVYCPSQV